MILNRNISIAQTYHIKDYISDRFIKINNYVYVDGKDHSVDVLRYEDLSLVANINTGDTRI